MIADYCSSKGILHQLSAARTPQQNGIAERRNRTLKEAAKTMLADTGMNERYWAEAINTACYTQNRCMINKHLNKTSYEIWEERKPNISYLHIFGCKCFVHNNGKDQLRTFQAKVDDAIFLGYSTTSKAYRVFNKRSLVVEESIHVMFNETQRSLNSEVNISTVRLEGMNLSDKKKVERRQLMWKLKKSGSR